MLFEQQDMQRQ